MDDQIQRLKRQYIENPNDLDIVRALYRARNQAGDYSERLRKRVENLTVDHMERTAIDKADRESDRLGHDAEERERHREWHIDRAYNPHSRNDPRAIRSKIVRDQLFQRERAARDTKPNSASYRKLRSQERADRRDPQVGGKRSRRYEDRGFSAPRTLVILERVLSEATDPDKLWRLWNGNTSPGEKANAAAAYRRITGKDPQSASKPTHGASTSGGSTTADSSWRETDEWLKRKAERAAKTRSNFTPYDRGNSDGKDEVQHHVDHWIKHRPHYNDVGDWHKGDLATADRHLRAAHQAARRGSDLESLGHRGGWKADPTSHDHLGDVAELYGGHTSYQRYHDQRGSDGESARQDLSRPSDGAYHFRDEDMAHAFSKSMRKAYRGTDVFISSPNPHDEPNAYTVRTRHGSKATDRAKRWS